MPAYADLNHDSGIARYTTGVDYIDVWFTDGSGYRYTDKSAGRDNILIMKSLAEAGKGLNRFINNNVKYHYETKL